MDEQTIWKSKVADLESWGWSLTAIAREVGTSLPTISDIKHGRRKGGPGGMVAVRLHNLHSTGTPPPQRVA